MEMMSEINSVDADKAAQIARKHAIALSGNLAAFTFKLLSVAPNSQEGIWRVLCEYHARVTDTGPARYMIKVNIATGTVISIEEQKG